MTEAQRIQQAWEIPIQVLELTPGWYLTKSDWQFARQTQAGITMTCNPLSADDLGSLDQHQLQALQKQYPDSRIIRLMIKQVN